MALEPAGVDERELSRNEIIHLIRERVLAAYPDVAGIILFGSLARGSVWRDVDVLVVAREPLRTRAEWAAAMRELQEVIGLVRLDVLPTHLEGLREGLAAHVPFLMDAAFDGLVIYDGGAIRGMLQEARREILERGITRTETGWRFPVKHRQSTLLSAASNADRADQWLADADRDLHVAEHLYQVGYFDRCVYHCQQSIERSVKAALICLGAFERTHWVGKRLAEEAARQRLEGWGERLNRLGQLSLRHEHAAIDARYILDEPEAQRQIWIPSEHYFEPEAAAALADAREALSSAREFVIWWFSPPEAAGQNRAPSS